MLIPTVLALSEFFSSNFPNISWYPYWYLGNPYHFLIGPVVPTLLGIVRGIGEVGGIKIPIDGAYLFLILGSLVLGGFGLYLFLKDWGMVRSQAIASGVLYTVLPAGFFLLNYQNGLNHIAMGVLPYILLLYRRFLQKPRHSGEESQRRLQNPFERWRFWTQLRQGYAGQASQNDELFLILLLSLITCFVLLTSISIFLPIVIGLIALFVSTERKHYSYEKIGKIILIILLSLSLSTLWYTAHFWWALTTNPSVGGVPFFKLLWSILQFLLQFLPLALAVVVVKWRKYRPKGHLLFGFLFFVSFLFLSLVRFVSDPDFVMDWVGFGLELQMGGAILAGGVLGTLSKKTMGRTVLAVCFIIVILLNCYIAKDVIAKMLNCPIVNNSMFQQFNNTTIQQCDDAYQNQVVSMIKNNVKGNERIFLSGSSVFFINSELNLQQVRGGVDQSSIHPFWAHGAYQIREGTNADLAYNWLKAMGVSYVLVHNKDSAEPFRDFKYPLKFADQPSNFKLISAKSDLAGTFDSAADRGDGLYKVQDSHIARAADKQILNVQKPKSGADQQAINNYNSSFKRPLTFKYQKPNEIVIEGNFKKGEVISLAISYDSLWRIAYGKGTTASDSLGSIVIIPENTGLQKFELVYKRSIFDLAIPLGLSTVIAIILIKYQKIAPYIRKKFPKLHVGLKEDDY